MKRSLSLHTPHGYLHGQLDRPNTPRGLILLARAHHVPVDAVIAAHLAEHGFAILSMELLTSQEAQFADATQNVPRLTQRLLDILDFIHHDGDMEDLPLAILATGDSSPAALRAAAQRDAQVLALACHGGLIDRAGKQALNLLVAPLLMLFDGDDESEENAYQRAAIYLGGIHQMHRLGIGGNLTMPVAEWFSRYLGR